MIKVISIDDFDKLCEYITDIRDAISSGGSGSGLPDYSTTEKKTGQKWIDGKDVWFKVVEGDLTSITTRIATGIDTLIQYSGYVYNSDRPDSRLYIPYNTSSSRTINITSTSSGVAISSSQTMVDNYNKYKTVLYYTKV